MRIQCKYCSEILEGKISFSRHCLRNHKSKLDKYSLAKHYDVINKKNHRKYIKKNIDAKPKHNNSFIFSIVSTPMK